ncbi:hypothetical protein BDB01DRAFT_835597 [Pilobolus umbonatus]|nr:hypothetical protein BDB01DRAFT_835597 [Pilobolus umbonatus]
MAAVAFKPHSISPIQVQTIIDTPLPSLSITNKPSTGQSIYHKCRTVLDKLALVEGMHDYLECDTTDIQFINADGRCNATSSLSNDPLSKLWSILRHGKPFATLYNATDPETRLNEEEEVTHVNDSKKIVYHFIVACRNQLKFKEEEVFTVSDLYKDNTNGFVKVVNTIEMILQLLEDKGVISLGSSNRDSFEHCNTPKDTRDKVVLELLETERKYVQDLEILQNYMRELQIQEVCSPDTIHYLFGNLNDLVDFQRRFLIHLEEIAENAPQDQNFGALFVQSENQFTVYEPYCANYFSAQDLVVQESPRLQKLADILNPDYELPSMLIKPVQRICKYPLLMQQLIKSTNADWPHYEELSAGLQTVKRVTENVNETQRKFENIQVVEEMKKRLDEMRSNNIDNYGPLLLHEKLMINSGDAEKEMQVYFFEKMIMICKEHKDASKNNHRNKNTITIKKKKRASLQPRYSIGTSRIIYARNKGVEGNWNLTIEWKLHEVDSLTLRFRNEEQLKLWESTINSKIKPLKKTNVSNTQLVSMKSYMNTDQVPAFLRTDEDDEDDDYDESEYQRSRSNSTTTHLLNSVTSNRPKTGRNMSIDQGKKGHHMLPNLIGGYKSGNNLSQSPSDLCYPISPPLSNPSSPTSSTRASQASGASNNRIRDLSPLTDIGTKFMNTNDQFSEEYRQYPFPQHPHMNRSQSHSAASPYMPLSNQPMYYTQAPARNRSQSSPNIHNGRAHQQQWEEVPQLPNTSRSTYSPPSPLDSPPNSSRISEIPSGYSSSTTVHSNATHSPIMMMNGSALKVKLNFNDGVYAIMCPLEISFKELMEKVERKIRLISNLQATDILRMKYEDEDGDMITINSDDDVQMAFENRFTNNINLFLSV